MEHQTFTATDDHVVHYYRWLPAGAVRGTIQIAHGMGEHAARYDWVAGELNAAGYAVYADDHRGHGRSAELGFGDLGEDGWNRTIADTRQLRELIALEYPGRPHALIGHSMGAMLTQQYLYRHGGDLQAAVISGSPGFSGVIKLLLSQTIAQIEAWRLGSEGESELLQKMLFGDANKPFDAPGASGFEWLSRDPEQVRRYVEDPACGFVLRAGSLARLFAGAREARSRRRISEIPAHLPVYVFSGSADPVHDSEKGLDRLMSRYQKVIRHLDYRLYEGGRHEMLNETNREAVMADLLSWLEQALFPALSYLEAHPQAQPEGASPA